MATLSFWAELTRSHKGDILTFIRDKTRAERELCALLLRVMRLQIAACSLGAAQKHRIVPKKIIMRDKLQKTLNGANCFIQSDYFIFLSAVIVLIGWCFDVWAAMLAVLVLLAIIPLFFGKGTKQVLCVVMMFTLIIRSNRHRLDDFAWLLSLVAVLLVGAIFNLVRYKRDFTLLSPRRIKGFHCSLIALFIPFALGGAGSPTENPIVIVTALALIVVAGIFYFFFVVTQDEQDRKGMAEYVLKVLFAMGVVICAQMVVYFSTFDSVDEIVGAMLAKNIALGWAGPNNVAPVLSMTIPASLYFCIKKNKATPLFAFMAVLEYLLIIATGCRGAILFTTIAMPAMCLYVMAKSENKILFGVTLSVILGVVVLVSALYGEYVGRVVSAIIGKGLDSSGRTEWLYPEAIGVFKKWPIFGSGWDYRLGDMAHNNYTPYWYHSTALQILATMGITGAIGFAFFYFFRYRTFFESRKKPAAVMLLCATVLFDAYGMIDTNFFGPTFFIMLLIMTFAVEIDLPDAKCRAFGGRNPFADMLDFFKHLAARLFVKKLPFDEYLREPQSDEYPEGISDNI